MGVIDDTQGKHIEQPVSIGDVQSVLGTTNGDLATLCMMNNINRWSAYKPVYNTKVSALTDADFANGRMSAYAGYIVTYGIKMRRSAALEDYMTITSSGSEVNSAVWGDDKPTQNNTNVFRLSDFNHYYHNSSIVKINLKMTFPSNTYFYIPQASETIPVAARSLTFWLSWLDIQGAVNASKLFNANNSLKYYIPTIILTYGSQAQYAKSAMDSNGNYIFISDIGSSNQSGVSISVLVADIGAALRYDNITLPNTELTWTACMVLVEPNRNDQYGEGIAGTSTNHKVFGTGLNKKVIRLEYLPPTNNVCVDRIKMTSAALKKFYVASVSVSITASKQSTPSSNGSFHRWNISSIVLTFVKNTEDSITYVLKGKYTCQVGNAYGNGSTDSQGYYTIRNTVTVTGSGTKTVTLTLQSNTIWYDPTSPESGSNIIRFSGSLSLQNSSYGNWSGNYGIETAPSEPYSTLSKTINFT